MPEATTKELTYRGGAVGWWGQMKTWFVFPFLIGYMFIMSGVIVSTLMLLAYICVWPLDRVLYRKIVLNLVYMSWSQFMSLSNWWSGSKLTLLANDPNFMPNVGKEHNLVISNHKYEAEFVMPWTVAERFGLLGGTKIFGKSVLKYLPIMGWLWSFTESIFVRRDWDKDRQTIIQDLQFIDEYPEGYYITLLLYPEGTRYTPEKHAACVEFSRSRGLVPLKHHLTPRTKGFTLIMKAIKRKVPVIYDLNVAFLEDGAPPTLSSLLQGKPTKCQIYARRILTETVPTDTEEACSEWLHQLFREKDEIFDNFIKNGRFTIGQEVAMPWRCYDLLVSVFWFVVLCVPLLVYGFHAFLTGSWLLKSAIVAFIAAVSIILKLLVAFTEIKRGSSYGRGANVQQSKEE